MAISRQKKEEMATDLTDKFSQSEGIIMTGYQGLSVTDLNRLRNQLREIGCSYQVAKNRIVKLVMEQMGLPVVESLFDGPTAIGFCYQEISGPAKVMGDFAEEMPDFSIRGGLLGDRVLTADEVSALAALPSREILLAQVVAGMQAPLAGLVNLLSGSIRNLVYVLQARTKQLEGTGG